MTLRDFEADVPVVEGGPELRGEVPGTVAPAGDDAVEPVSGGRRRRASRTAISRRLLRVARPVPLLVLALVASLLWAASLGLDARSHHRDAADGREAVAAAQT
ncbi:MAG TPA: hypothetical protein VNC22_13565, partial [Sporichthya sp.]|nr:hypothetical protein [Sporichthya sp.]